VPRDAGDWETVREIDSQVLVLDDDIHKKVSLADVGSHALPAVDLIMTGLGAATRTTS